MSRYQSSLRDIKREKKKSLYLQEFSVLLHELTQDEPAIGRTFVTHVDLSPDSGVCYVYFSTYPSQDPTKTSLDVFNEALQVLKLYKNSIRKVFGQRVKTRYIPDFRFLFDEKKDKQRKIDKLLDKVQSELCTDKESFGDGCTSE